MFQSPSTEPLASSSFPPTLARAQSFLDARTALDEGKRNRSLSDLQVRGGVFRRGPIDYNGCGAFLGTADGRKRESRCGNCGDFDHITVDCTLLTLSPDASAPPHSYIQKERRRSNSLLEMCKEESDKLALEQAPSHTKLDDDDEHDPLALA